MKIAENQLNSMEVTDMSITLKSVLYLSLVRLVMRKFLFSSLKEKGLNIGACLGITSVSYQENKSNTSNKSKNTEHRF